MDTRKEELEREWRYLLYQVQEIESDLMARAGEIEDESLTEDIFRVSLEHDNEYRSLERKQNELEKKIRRIEAELEALEE